jgi:UDP-N-acetylmuramoylalanine--D-glutamate ligase
LAELVVREGAVVLNAEDPVVAGYADLGRAPVVFYRRDWPLPGNGGGLGIVDGWIVAAGISRLALAGGGRATTGSDGRIMPVSELAIPGAHNISNALAAIAAALLLGVTPEAIRETAPSFQGVEHRLERVAVIDGVRFINDSQGTQPDAVTAALNAFEPPIVLIAGGRAKGLDLDALARVVAARAVAAVLIGESGPDLEASFRAAGLAQAERAPDLEAAVRRADAIARDALGASVDESRGPATVLLSPAAASFDMFSDYAARGQAFKDAVAALAADRARGGTR